MNPMHEALKQKMNSLKGPSDSLMGDDEGHATGGEAIDLSKIDPKLIEAIMAAMKSSDGSNPAQMAAPAKDADMDAMGVKTGSDQAPVREAAANAIADGGTKHESGGLHARAAMNAKNHLANMKSKSK